VIEQNARVVGIADGSALVEVSRQSGCSSCGHDGSCGTSVVAKLFGGVVALDTLNLEVRANDILDQGPNTVEAVIVEAEDHRQDNLLLVFSLLRLPFALTGRLDQSLYNQAIDGAGRVGWGGNATGGAMWCPPRTQ